MESNEDQMGSEANKNIKKIYAEFMTGIAQFDELVAEGGRLLAGFQQGLEFLRRPPIEQTSAFVGNIIKANETTRLKSYMKVGCINVDDGIQNMTKLNRCQSGLRDHLTKARGMLDELETLVEDVYDVMQIENRMLLPLEDKNYGIKFDQISLEDESVLQAADFQEEATLSQFQNPEVTDHVALIGIIYIMVKQDFAMQERIVPCLNLKTPPGELETYCMMWSLRPFVDDEIMETAWKHIHA